MTGDGADNTGNSRRAKVQKSPVVGLGLMKSSSMVGTLGKNGFVNSEQTSPSLRGISKPSPTEAIIKSRKAITAQRRREKDLIKADRLHRAEESVRIAAKIAQDEGNSDAFRYVNDGPTPEQLGQGLFEKYASKLSGHDDQRVETVCRVSTPFVYQFYFNGVIDDQQLTACRWYRDTHEATGLCGNIASSDYAKEVFSGSVNGDVFSAWQIDCQDMIRAVRKEMTKRYLQFFDAIVLNDCPPRKAIRLAKKRNGTEVDLFRSMAAELQDCYSKLKK